LNTLAAVDNRGASASGQILFNGKSLMKGYRKVVAYVQQADTLYDTLTVHECIEYSAFLRLSSKLTKLEKRERVNQTIQELHLEKVANSRIEEISGGERRRVSIGMELVNEAKVLMLDGKRDINFYLLLVNRSRVSRRSLSSLSFSPPLSEPTSGLDSNAANSIMSILSELASRGRIIILSIHQPSMKSFMLMDKIMLLAEGRVMYNGGTSEAANYFGAHGFSCPENESISDYVLDVISEKANHDTLAGLEPQERDFGQILAKMESAEDASETCFDDEGTGWESIERRSIANEFAVLFVRAAKDILRNRTLFIMQLLLSVILALFAGGIFNNVSNDLAGFQNRMGGT
jgi:ABC-type multidrug transport system ATPase subunit